MFDAALADYATQMIAILKLTGDFHGESFELMPWQEKIIRDVYGTLNERRCRQYRYIYIETAKKNAKSQLIAGSGSCTCSTDPNRTVRSCCAPATRTRPARTSTNRWWK